MKKIYAYLLMTGIGFTLVAVGVEILIWILKTLLE